jgi:hypothetical protein
MANSTSAIETGGIGQDGRRFHVPCKTSTDIYAGTMVAQEDVTGLLVAATTASSGRVIGIATQTIESATAGQRCLVETDRIYLRANGSSTNAFSDASQIGAPAYAYDDHTVYDNSNGDTLPFAGFFRGMEADGQVRVEIVANGYAEIDAEETSGDVVTTLRARNIVNGDVADLAAYTVASDAAVNDATLNVAGDVVLLVDQTTAAQNGLYIVGTVAAGVAPLTRHPAMFTGRVFRADDYDIVIAAGAVFAHTRWFNSAAGTIGTNTPAFFPESVTISQALVTGTMTITSIPILSATKSAISAYRKTANTCTSTIQYVTNGAATAGALGTASVEVMAAVAAGTINASDVSTLHVTITNR